MSLWVTHYQSRRAVVRSSGFDRVYGVQTLAKHDFFGFSSDVTGVQLQVEPKKAADALEFTLLSESCLVKTTIVFQTQSIYFGDMNGCIILARQETNVHTTNHKK